MPPLTLPEIERRDGMPTHEWVHKRLRQAIMVGVIRPGMALTIRGLSDALESSPTPVREALRRLSSEGALQVLDNRRIKVPKMTPGRFEELIALRITVEAHAGRRAIPHLTDRQIDAIEAIDNAQNEAIARGDKAAALVLNQDFHRALYLANPEAIAMPMVESIWLQLGPFLGIAMQHVESLYVVDRHVEMVAAMRKRNADELAEAIEADIKEGIGGFARSAIEHLLKLSGEG